MASQPTSIFLFNNHLAFIYSLSFCQENQFDVTDLAFLDFFGIVVFEDLEIACLIMNIVYMEFGEDALCTFCTRDSVTLP